MQSLKIAGSNGETTSMATEVATPYSGQRVTWLKRMAQDFYEAKESPCTIKRRSQAAKLCSNPNCTNTRDVKKQFANKLGFYCQVLLIKQQCVNIIDLDEYCHICLEITSPQEKCWAACDRCKCWNHIACEEKLRKGIKNLQVKLENPNYIYICGNCRTSTVSFDYKKKANADRMSEKMRKMSDATASHTKEKSASKELAYQNYFELCKMAHQKKKYATPHNYIYFYSENYQLVDRMVSARTLRVTSGQKTPTHRRRTRRRPAAALSGRSKARRRLQCSPHRAKEANC